MFCKWLHTEGITDLRNLDSDEIQRYKEHRLEKVKPITARNDMRTVKNFVQFCESIQAVPQGLSGLVRIPKVSEDDEICDDLLTREEAVELLDYLSKYEYASIRHVPPSRCERSESLRFQIRLQVRESEFTIGIMPG